MSVGNYTIRISYDGGGSASLPFYTGRIERDLRERPRAPLATYQSDFAALAESPTPYEDTVSARKPNGDIIWQGPLRRVEQRQDAAVLVTGSPGEYAARGEPTSGGVAFENASVTDVVDDATSRVNALSTGAIDGSLSTVTYVFNHATPAFQVRKAASVTGGEVVWNRDGSVDVLAERGSDRSGDFELSPSAGTVDDSRSPPTVETSGEPELTHFRAIGANQGEYQAVATAVASDYSPGDPQVWTREFHRDIDDEGTLQGIADDRLAELRATTEEITLDATGVDLNLGDRVPVTLPSEDVDDTYRVVSYKRLLVPGGDDVYEGVTLSDRYRTRDETGRAARDSISAYQQGYEGVPVQLDQGRAMAVDDENPFTMAVYYPAPPVEEIRAELRVAGGAYRIDSRGGAAAPAPHEHDLGFSSEQNSQYTSAAATAASATTTTDYAQGTWNTVRSFSPSEDTAWWRVAGQIVNGNGATELVRVRVHRPTTQANYPTSTGATLSLPSDASSEFSILVPGNVNGDTYEIQVEPTLQSPSTLTTATYAQGVSQHTHFIGDTTQNTSVPHAHPPEPGIQTSFPPNGAQFFARDCQVTIDGFDVGPVLGTSPGPFEATVDVTDAFTAGSWNTVEISSTSKGRIEASLDVDLLKRRVGTSTV